MSVNLWRVVLIPTTVLALVTSMTGISHLTVNKITLKRSEAIRHTHIPNQYQRFWVLQASRERTAILICATIGATMCIHMINTGLCILDMVHCAESRQQSI